MSEKIKYKGYRIVIEQDEDAENPYKDWDQLSDVNFWLRNYDLDSTGAGQLEFKSPQEVMKAYESGKLVYAQWIHAYMHSGITISLDKSRYPFTDPLDSELAGAVYVTKEKAKAEFPNYSGRTLWLACERVVKFEIEALDQYLTGDVWYYSISHKKVDKDSCGGMYGYEYCVKEAKEIVDQYIEEELNGHEKVLDEWFGFIPQEVMNNA